MSKNQQGFIANIFAIISLLIVSAVLFMAGTFIYHTIVYATTKTLITLAPSAQLDKHNSYDYFAYDVSKNKGFGGYRFLSKVGDQPFVLTGGLPFSFTGVSVEVENTADEKIKLIKFSEQKYQKYGDETCVSEIQKNIIKLEANINNLASKSIKIDEMCRGGIRNKFASLDAPICFYLNDSKINLDEFKTPTCSTGVNINLQNDCAVGKTVTGNCNRRDALLTANIIFGEFNSDNIEFKHRSDLEYILFPKETKSQKLDSAEIVSSSTFEPDKQTKCSSSAGFLNYNLCLNKELNVAFEKLNAAFLTAKHDVSSPTSLSIDQNKWRNSLDNCSDQDCIRDRINSRYKYLVEKQWMAR